MKAVAVVSMSNPAVAPDRGRGYERSELGAGRRTRYLDDEVAGGHQAKAGEIQGILSTRGRGVREGGGLCAGIVNSDEIDPGTVRNRGYSRDRGVGRRKK
ncbi:MAG: hypothetical protein E6H59_02775 [Betaproteobacteria bacterium]|nr:MAG: hypothetical protein E6H59_02775 [Betaproteobacteria bacterium]